MADTLLHIVGVPSDTVWSKVLSLQNGSLHLCIALTLQVDSGDAHTVGKRYTEEIEQWFLTCTNLQSGIDFLSRYSLPAQCESAFCFFDRESGLFRIIGNGKIGVHRAGSGLIIVDPVMGSTAMQGKVYPGDILVFGTKLFSERYLSQILEASDVMTTAEKWSSDPQVSTSASVSGGVFVVGGGKAMTTGISPSIPPVIESTKATPVVPQRRKSFRIWYPVGFAQRKVAMIVVVIIVVTALFLFIQHFVLARRQSRIQSVVAPLESALAQATGGSLPRIEKERQLADLIKDRDEAVIRYADDSAIKRELEIFSLKLTEQYEKISARRYIDNLPVFYDFRLITADFVASQVAYDIPGKLVVFLDASRGKIVTLSVEKKQPQSVSINTTLGEVKSLTVTDRTAYVLGTLGIYSADLPLDVAGKMVASSSASWQAPKLLGSFSDNLYVFDSQARQIWRYDRNDFSASPSAWLRGKEGVDIESINSLSIDGDIWLSTLQGKLYKFSRGDRNAFSYTDILQPPASTISTYTDENTQNLYVLEPKEQRLLILTKSGQYISSVVSKDFATATGLVVDESLKRAYVVAGSLVYEVEL